MTSEKKRQIVLVDDDSDIQDLVTAYFRPKNFDVTCYTDAQDAIEASLVSGHEWDVMLTDFHFKKMSEMDFADEIKKSLPNLPIILITPPEASETAFEVIQKGAYDLVFKPIQFQKLQASVNFF